MYGEILSPMSVISTGPFLIYPTLQLAQHCLSLRISMWAAQLNDHKTKFVATTLSFPTELGLASSPDFRT
jgi:hypothetical protein